MAMMMMMQVPTKTSDGGSTKAKMKVLRSSERHIDAFSYYSSRDIRMDALLGRRQEEGSAPVRRDGDNDSVEPAPPAPKKAKKDLPEAPQEDRQTRLSFELHPHLIMMRLLEEMDAEAQ